MTAEWRAHWTYLRVGVRLTKLRKYLRREVVDEIPTSHEAEREVARSRVDE